MSTTFSRSCIAAIALAFARDPEEEMSALSLTSGCAARAGGERADGEAATAGEVGDERDASVAAGEGGSGEGGSAESLDGAALGAGGETADVEGALLIALGSVTPRETLSRSSVDGRFMENVGLTVWAGCWATTGELFGFATSANPSLADSLRSSASSAADILGSQPAARGGCALLSLCHVIRLCRSHLLLPFGSIVWVRAPSALSVGGRLAPHRPSLAGAL